MLSRREVLIGGIAAGTLLHLRPVPAQAPQPSATPNFEVLEGACDCHTHVFGDPAQFPLSPARSYTPAPALPEEMARLHRTLRIQRVVIVTPSAYGTDNSATLYGVQARGGNARAIVVIDEHVSDGELLALDRAGARGVRLFLAGNAADPGVARQRFQATADRIKGSGWHIQIFTAPAIVSALKDLVLAAPVPVVFDHFGGARGAAGTQEPGFQDLLGLVRSGRAYVKVSAAYRFSTRAPDYDDMLPLTRSLVAANPERILWATDWPHTNGDIPGKKPTDIFPFIDVDDAQLLNLFARWVPEPALRQRILVDNPAQLYGFQSA